jgi:Fur family ferric uptake transcriptional regulator
MWVKKRVRDMDDGKNSKEAEIFSGFLKSKGLSFTKQRRLVLEEVFRNHNHFEAEEIVELLRKKNQHVSRATVYRTLTHLEDCSLIGKVDLGHGHSHYEHILGHEHHEHLYCEKCGKLLEFSDSLLERRIVRIAESNRFTITSHTVQIFGICNKCGKKEK